MLDVRRLRVLASVVSSGSITAAAANLGYTPSAISQQIAALQREAGTELLHKDGRGVRPTAAGTLLTEHAAGVMAKLAEAEAALAALVAGSSGRLAMTYFATAGAALVPPAVARFRRSYPDLRLDLRLNEPAYRIRELEDGPADIELVVLREVTAQPDGVELVHLLDDPYRVVLPGEHPLCERETFDLAELADEPWVDTEWPHGVCREIMFDACAGAGFSPNIVVESDDYPTAQGFVAAGLGVTLIPELALGTVAAGVAVRKIRRPTPARSIYAVVRSTSMRRAEVGVLLDALRAVAGGVHVGNEVTGGEQGVPHRSRSGEPLSC